MVFCEMKFLKSGWLKFVLNILSLIVSAALLTLKWDNSALAGFSFALLQGDEHSEHDDREQFEAETKRIMTISIVNFLVTEILGNICRTIT